MSIQAPMIQIGDVLGGRYRIVAEGVPQDIGTQYKAYDSQRERLVVVLVLDPRFAGSRDALERLARSQQAVADLAVPALVPAEDVGVVAGQLYLVRNQVDGYPLAHLLTRLGSLKANVAVQLTIRLCEALAPAHRAGLVHGSLSPHCVLVGDDGQVVLTDVGLLPALQSAAVSDGQPWGRAPYLSPEQAAGETAHPATDVYVIGSLLYQMLAGRPPFHCQDEVILAVRHLHQDPPDLQVLVPDVPLALAQIVHKALAKEPAARYRHAGQLAHILRSQLGTQPAEPVLPRLTAQREHLVVPAPPVGETYEPDVAPQDWSVEPAGVDWLMVALIVAALIAVLGLIPLWRTVYRRYATPAPTPQLSLFGQYQGEWAPSLLQGDEGASGAIAEVKLDDYGPIWYNWTLGKPAQTHCGKSDTFARDGLPNPSLFWPDLAIRPERRATFTLMRPDPPAGWQIGWNRLPDSMFQPISTGNRWKTCGRVKVVGSPDYGF